MKKTPEPKKRAPKKTAKTTAATKPRPAKAPTTTKTDQVLELLRRPDGATAAELMSTTGWQAHSLRGFLSGSLRKKQGLAVELVKVEGAESRYKITA